MTAPRVPMALTCRVSPAAKGLSLRWQSAPARPLGRDQVRVAVQVASVNPIDVKRAAGYGQRVLSLMGAGGAELVLGNDFAGVVTEVGSGVKHLAPGVRVWGLVPTGAQGSHRSEVCVSTRWVRPLPDGVPMASAAVLPYTFTTLWRALAAVGLDAQTAGACRVLINGAGGALGQLAIQVLSRWGASVTAVCGPRSLERSVALGAAQVVDRHATALSALPSAFDATLNFGLWADDAEVMARLHASARGHATTVHPLLAEIDAHGWMAGGLSCWRAWQGGRRRLQGIAPPARQAWTVFRPDEGAMDALQASLLSRPLVLDVAHRAPFGQADSAFVHVGQGRSTRAVLVAHL